MPSRDSYTLNKFEDRQFRDYPSELLHLTGRTSTRTECPVLEIREANGMQRLVRILRAGSVRAFPMFAGLPSAACFTENSEGALNWLISRGLYTPWGVAFTKDVVFHHGGAPVIEVRGDEWPSVASMPDHLRARVKRLWPGAAAPLGVKMPWYASDVRSEWSFEREWRIPLNDVTFEPYEVAFVICSSRFEFDQLRYEVGLESAEMARRLGELPNRVWDPALQQLVAMPPPL